MATKKWFTATQKGSVNDTDKILVYDGTDSRIVEVSSIRGTGTLNRIEVLETEPSKDELYEGRIWIYKAPDLSCTNITLSSNTLTFTNKEPQTLTYTTVPSNTTDNVAWSVNPSGIVVINNGVVSPKANGNCIITATCGSQTATCNVSVSGLVEVEIPKNGLMIWIDSDDFTNSPQTTILNDKSGNSNNFTVSGFDYTTDSGLNNDNKLVFDGIDDKLYITQGNISISISNGFTIAFKLSINDLSQTNKELIDCNFNPENQQLTVIYGYVNNTVELYGGDGLDFRTGSQITINDTNFHTIIYSYDGSTLKGYLDGNEVVSVSKTIALNNPINELSIGGNVMSAGVGAYQSFTDITFDNFLLYNRVLTTEEITKVS